MLHISLSGEVIGNIFGLPITNSLFTTWIVMVILTILAVFVKKNISTIPSKFQLTAELLVSSLYSLFEGVFGEKTKRYFPLVATLFIFIWFNNLVGILPGVNSIGIKESRMHATQTDVTVEEAIEGRNAAAGRQVSGNADTLEHVEEDIAKTVGEENALHQEENTELKLIPIFRPSNADLNTTLALAIIAILAVQYYGIKSLGLGIHVSKYLNFKNPMEFFVGVLEIISEFSRIVSFAFRLFGNIFAGEVLLTVIAFLIPVIAPIPFMGMELFVGFIQALVFSMLTAVFLALATAEHH